MAKPDCYLRGIDGAADLDALSDPNSAKPLAATDEHLDDKIERICDGLVKLAASGRRLEERCDAYERSLRR